MILDNADDPKLFREAQDGQSSQAEGDLSSYIPDCRHGSILITTRDLVVGKRLANGRPPIRINKMLPEEAVAMLKTRLPTGGGASPLTSSAPPSVRQHTNDNDLFDLARSLDYLPLAMVQAAAFITENGISIGHYAKLFEDDASAVQLLMHNVQESGQDSDIPSSVYTTWKISIEQIQEAYAKSAELIFLMAHYEQTQIPAALLQHHVGNDDVEFTTMIGVLLRFSLIAGGPDATYNMHRLVQLIVRQWLAASASAAEWQSKALRLLSNQFPDGDFETWAVCASLEPHAIKMIRTSAIEKADKSYLGTLQMNLAWYYSRRGSWSSAPEHARAACITLQEAYGPRHRDTLAAKIKLVLVLKMNTMLEEAEVIIKQTVDETKALLGSKDPQYFDALECFALLAQTRGNLVVAEKAARKALSGREKVLGRDHPSLNLSRRRLAAILEFMGKYDQAEACILSALDGQKRLAGPADESTILIMQRLVFIRHSQGKYAEEEKGAREYLELTSSTYGPNNMNTKEAEFTFANALVANNKIEEAETIFMTLTKFIEEEHPFEADHQYNFFVQASLARIRMIQGRYAEASRILKTACEGIQKTYSKHHAKTYEYQSLYGSALAMADASQLDAAMVHQQEAYDGLKIVVGKEHPSTLTAMLCLSDAYAMKRDLGRALKLAEQVSRGREKKLNVNHPDTLAARQRVVELRKMQKEPARANMGPKMTDTVSSEKQHKKKGLTFGSKSRPAYDGTTVVEIGHDVDGIPTEEENIAHVAAEELEHTSSNNSATRKRMLELGLFAKDSNANLREKIVEKELESNAESDSGDRRGEENLDFEKSEAFVNHPPRRPPPLPPRPLVDMVSGGTAKQSQSHHSKNDDMTDIPDLPSQTIQHKDPSESTGQRIRRKPLASRPPL